MRKKNLKKSRSLRSLSSQNFDFCACPSHNVVKRNASGKKGKLSCCKCLFDQIRANVAHIPPENLQNVKKCVFDKKLLKATEEEAVQGKGRPSNSSLIHFNTIFISIILNLPLHDYTTNRKKKQTLLYHGQF